MNGGASCVEAFVAAAVEFCTRALTPDVSAEELQSILINLDRLVTELPSPEPSEIEYPDPPDLDEECRIVAARVGALFGDRCFYESGPATMGDLRDDFFDIYRDVRRGLEVFESSPDDAVWEWRFSHRSHWGVHASGARTAMGQLDR